MNRDWLRQNFLVPREKQTRNPLPNPPAMAKFMAQFTAAPLRTQLALRLWLANPDRYETLHYYDDTVERIQAALEEPPCCYCGDLLVDPRQGVWCAHRQAICRECLDAYYGWYKFSKPCGRKLVDGTRCAAPTFFRLNLLDPQKLVHDEAEQGCEHGFVFRYQRSMEFRCFAPGCSKLNTLAEMLKPAQHEADAVVLLD